MRKIIPLVILISSLFFLIACASDDEIANELIDYYNNEWIPLHVMKKREVDTVKKFALNISAESDEELEKKVIKILEEDVIPVADNIIDRYESIELKQREIKKLNKMQLKAEKNGKDLIKNIISFYKGDISKSEYKNNEYDLNKEFDEVNDYLEKLMDKYNLEYDKTKDSNEGYYEIKRKEK